MTDPADELEPVELFADSDELADTVRRHPSAGGHTDHDEDLEAAWWQADAP